jgi:hypothetical protein
VEAIFASADEAGFLCLPYNQTERRAALLNAWRLRCEGVPRPVVWVTVRPDGRALGEYELWRRVFGEVCVDGPRLADQLDDLFDGYDPAREKALRWRGYTTFYAGRNHGHVVFCGDDRRPLDLVLAAVRALVSHDDLARREQEWREVAGREWQRGVWKARDMDAPEAVRTKERREFLRRWEAWNEINTPRRCGDRGARLAMLKPSSRAVALALRGAPVPDGAGNVREDVGNGRQAGV